MREWRREGEGTRGVWGGAVATEGGVMMRKGWRERLGGGGLEEEVREKAHAGGLRVWDVGSGGVP